MAENEPIAKRLTEQLAKLNARAGAMKDPKNADRVLVMTTLALLSEGLAKLNRDVSDLKKRDKPAAAGESQPKGSGDEGQPGAKPGGGLGGKPKGPGGKGPGGKGPGSKGLGGKGLGGKGQGANKPKGPGMAQPT